MLLLSAHVSSPVAHMYIVYNIRGPFFLKDATGAKGTYTRYNNPFSPFPSYYMRVRPQYHSSYIAKGFPSFFSHSPWRAHISLSHPFQFYWKSNSISLTEPEKQQRTAHPRRKVEEEKTEISSFELSLCEKPQNPLQVPAAPSSILLLQLPDFLFMLQQSFIAR